MTSEDEVEETEFLDDAEESPAEVGFSEGIPNELEEDELLDIGALAEVQDKVFEEISLPEEIVAEVQTGWHAFIQMSASRDAAGAVEDGFRMSGEALLDHFMNGLKNV